jgi:hypothetical protein
MLVEPGSQFTSGGHGLERTLKLEDEWIRDMYKMDIIIGLGGVCLGGSFVCWLVVGLRV